MAKQMAEGRYCGWIVRAETCESEKEGEKRPYMAIEFSVPYVDVDSEWVALDEPVCRTMVMSLKETAYPYTVLKLELLGFNGDFVNPQFQNQEGVVLVCKHTERNDRIYEDWNLDYVPDGGGRKSATQETMMQLQQRWNQNKMAKAAPATPPPKAPATKPPHPSQVTASTQVGEVETAKPVPPKMPQSMEQVSFDDEDGDDEKEDDIPF